MSAGITLRMRRFRARAEVLLLREALDTLETTGTGSMSAEWHAKRRGHAAGLRHAIDIVNRAYSESAPKRKRR